MPNGDSATTPRTLWFYHIHALDSNGNILSFSDLQDLFTTISSISQQNPSQVYLQWNRDIHLRMYDIAVKSTIFGDVIFGKIGYSRRSNLPLIDQQNSLAPLTLQPNQYLYEPTHFTLFNNNVLIIEYNQFGPKSASFKRYLEQIAEILGYVNLEIQLRRLSRVSLEDLKKKLDNIEIRWVQLDIAVPSILSKERVDDVIGTLSLIKNLVRKGALKVALRFGVGRKRNHILDVTTDDLFKILENYGDCLETFKVYGKNVRTGKPDSVDLLEDFIISRKDINYLITHNGCITRSVDPNSMFEAMIDAYRENKELVEKAIRNIL